MTYPIPGGIPNLPMAVTGQNQPMAEMQTGTVLSFTASGLYVAPGGDSPPVLAGYLRNMYHPVVGETVALIRQGASWLALGGIAGPEDVQNEVRNYSFEESAVGVAPVGWTQVNTSGSATFTTVLYTASDFIDGAKVGSINAVTATSVDTSVYSWPIPVEAEQRWGLASYYRTNADFGSSSVTLRLYAAWYTTSATSSLISETHTATWQARRGFRWQLMTENGESGDGVLAPAGAEFLRVRIRATWSSAAADALYLDRVTARRTL